MGNAASVNSMRTLTPKLRTHLLAFCVLGLAMIGMSAFGARQRQPKMLEVSGSIAVTPSGVRVRFLGVSEDLTLADPKQRLDDHTWSPDGSRYAGDSRALMTVSDNFNCDWQSPRRALTFELETPGNLDLDVFGYVPGHRQWRSDAQPNPGFLGPQKIVQRYPKFVDRFPVNITDPKATRFCLGIASGPWKQAANFDVTGFSPDESRTIGSGSWGSLKMIGRHDMVGVRGISFSGHMPTASFFVDAPTDERQYAYRIRYFDQKGREEGSAIVPSDHPLVIPGARTLEPTTRITVEIRPYSWIDFRGVHFNPPARDKSAEYWGADIE